MLRRPWDPIIEGDTAKVPLTRGQFALIDVADLDRVYPFSWQVKIDAHTSYATGHVSGRTVSLHNFILGTAPDGMVIDHINRDGLDNRQSNLRFCTPSQNALNRRAPIRDKTKFKGVYWDARYKKWYAAIKAKGRRLHLGTFVDERLAALRYNIAAYSLFGEDARLNKIGPASNLSGGGI